jgi:hypothetical protein
MQVSEVCQERNRCRREECGSREPVAREMRDKMSQRRPESDPTGAIQQRVVVPWEFEGGRHWKSCRKTAGLEDLGTCRADGQVQSICTWSK